MSNKRDQIHLDDPAPRRWRPLAALRNSFLTGLVVIAPAGLTVWLFWSLAGWIDGFVLPLIPLRYRPEQYIGVDIRGIGVVVFLLFTIIVGWLAKGLIGRSLLNFGERIVNQMPIVRSVYSAVKQIAETVFAQNESSFDRACLIEYPRKGVWSVAFISTTTKGEINRRVPEDDQLLSIFVPTTPNPTSGYLLFLPRSEVVILEMSVEAAAKLVVSAGLVYPKDDGETAPNGAADTPTSAHVTARTG